ncbi:MAG: cobalamin-binding protein [Lysobacterales bacterium]
MHAVPGRLPVPLAGLAAFCLVLTTTPALSAEVRLRQADGSELVLSSPAKTLITLAPHLTELAFAAGAGKKIIATVEFSEFPAPAAGIPRIGDAFRLDLERILTLQPDLVIAWESGNPRAAVAHLESLGIVTWKVEIRRPEEIATVLEDMGRAGGDVRAAKKAADSVRTRLQELAGQYAGLPPVTYFYQVAENPLFTINGEHLISRSLALCGARNVFADAGGLALTVTREAVIAADPQVLLAPAERTIPDPLLAWRDWPAMRAVKSGAMYLLPADAISRATPRLLEAVAYGCELMHQVQGENAFLSSPAFD